MTLPEALFYLLVALQIADGYTTIKALRTGNAREANPIVAKLIGAVGRDRAVAGLKLIAIAGLWYGRADTPLWAMGALAALYAYTIINNVRVMRRSAK
ncbi:MAG: DUF5658 family protein [Giesbergeria sp.]